MSPGRYRWRLSLLPAVLGVAALATVIGLFWPGFMSPDSASQWAQARSGRYVSVHPPIMAMIWSRLELVWSGPGALFTLHLSLFWLALIVLARSLFRDWRVQAALVLGVGLWPPILATTVHVWKDVGMVAFALLGVAMLAWEWRRPGRWSLLLALLLFAIACAYRHNAIALALPWLYYLAGRVGAAVPALSGRGRQGLLCVLLVGLVVLLAALPSRHPAVSQRQVWPVVALWDLAAVSIARNEMRIPVSWRIREFDLDELSAVFTPWSNTSIFATGALEVSLYFDPTPRQDSALRSAWLRLWYETPADYFRHRLRLAALLFGLRPRELPSGLAMMPGISQLDVNPPLQMPDSPLRDRVVARLLAWVPTPLFAAWVYLLLLAGVAATAWRRPVSPLFWPLVMSVVFACLPLLVLAPSAEFRYVLWPVLASLLAIFIRLAPVDPRPADAG